MTSFFTLNIGEFQRNEEGTLGLGYVSYIICKNFGPCQHLGCANRHSPNIYIHLGDTHLDCV